MSFVPLRCKYMCLASKELALSSGMSMEVRCALNRPLKAELAWTDERREIAGMFATDELYLANVPK